MEKQKGEEVMEEKKVEKEEKEGERGKQEEEQEQEEGVGGGEGETFEAQEEGIMACPSGRPCIMGGAAVNTPGCQVMHRPPSLPHLAN